ncbi:16S rRNA (cytidine(1402)-2'-O)-methyltransferase [Cohaesibacter sp. CAU 1516]|uniref:16S rRNA (cytidine(1402)-2'-O)-methyltransferase n=1 Tax=Cohaesibacter sp. CAU 1516 TaxID=2576038 RepID=UPI0010FE24B5|nr:16S rRNA (cytidine(1402)-2'-O)-methyltransferase [Cohaesibacter sp. CAU 1516]TLP47136.1 16S rRNA (cytidine(1402)-2'-O)-methyltransferase [Cohaesibacter sp. CAU 1516]
MTGNKDSDNLSLGGSGDEGDDNQQKLAPEAPTDDAFGAEDSDVAEGEKSSYFVAGTKLRATDVAAGLYIVSTPIGNLKDITIRALESLAAADMVACEDTRVSRKLLTHYGIRTRLITYHEHNADRQRPYILNALAEGKAVCLISDAGTPLLSDPGYKLVGDVIEAGHAVIPIPGASAMLAALVAAGLPTDQIHFAGFLPQKAGARDRKLMDLSGATGTLVFYESPRRLAPVLSAMATHLGGERHVVVARELTKKFEEFKRGTLTELAALYAESDAPRGEAVVLIGPRSEPDVAELDVEALIREGLNSGLHVKQLSADIAARVGAKKNDIYKLAQTIKDQLSDED